MNDDILPENMRLKGYSGYDLSINDSQPIILNPSNYPPPPPPPNTFGHTMKHQKKFVKRKFQESPNNYDMPSTLNGFTTLQAGGFHEGSQSQMSHLLML